MLTSTLRQYFQKLNNSQDITTYINDEIENLCSTHNPSELIDEFADILTSTQFLRKTIKLGETFYRARLGKTKLLGAVDDCNTTFILPYYGKDIEKPPALRTSGGRFNRAGQSFLYLSSDVETAIAEVHLAVGQECSVGEFKCVKDVELIDLSEACISQDTVAAASKANALIITFWRNFLLQPVYSETKHKYLLTQFITDAILKTGVSGIFFNSIQAKGNNVVCFEDDRFEVVKFSEKLYRADKIDYKISQVKDSVRQWYKSHDWESISGFNEDESEQRDKEIDYFRDWIEHERREKRVPDAITQRLEKLKKLDGSHNGTAKII